MSSSALRIASVGMRWRALLVTIVLCIGCGSSKTQTDTNSADTQGPGFEAGCVPGYRSCDGNSVVVCAADGIGYNVVRDCSEGLVCTQGICAVCNPNQPFCQGGTVAVCDDAGEVTAISQCTDACAGGLCVKCIPGRRECRSGVFGGYETWVCVATSKETADWTLVDRCGTADECSNGLCISPCQNDVKIDTNQGCDYYAVDLENSDQLGEGTTTSPADAQFAIIVYNPSREDTLEVDVLRTQTQQQAEITVTVAPSALETIKLEPRNISGSLIGAAAWRIRGNRPFVAYQFNPLDNDVPVFSNDASLLLPINALGREYRALTGVGGGPFITVVGTANNTSVTITPTAAIGPSVSTTSSQPVPSIEAGESETFTINAGDVLNLKAVDQPDADLSGTLISSDRTISVFSGNVAATTGPRCCADHLEQQLPPLKSWGQTFIGARSEPRANEPDHWAVMAREDDTDVEIAGGITKSVTIKAGEPYRFSTDADFILSAKKPVLVAQFLASSFEVLDLGDFCQSNSDCATGVCSEPGSGGGRCTPTCEPTPTECGLSDVCIDRRLIDGEAGGTCRYRPCGGSMPECPADRSCVVGDGLSVCLESCTGVGSDCENPAQLCQFATEDNYCIPNQCSTDDDCEGSRCEVSTTSPGRCVTDCTPESNCDDGHACLPAGYATGQPATGVCVAVDECSLDADCPEGHTCAERGGTRNCQPIGDPAFILSVPTEQWRDSYTFLAPTGYQEDYVNITFYKGTSASIDGQPVGPGLLVPGTDARVARIRIDDGAHTVTADKPVGVTVYGYHDDVSYGYPAGANLFELDVQ